MAYNGLPSKLDSCSISCVSLYENLPNSSRSLVARRTSSKIYQNMWPTDLRWAETLTMNFIYPCFHSELDTQLQEPVDRDISSIGRRDFACVKIG